MAGNQIAPRGAELLDHRMNRRGNGENRRLRILRQLQLLLGTLETELRDRESDGPVVVVEHAASGRIFFGDIASHSGVLTALPRKNEGGVVLHSGANSSRLGIMSTCSSPPLSFR